MISPKASQILFFYRPSADQTNKQRIPWSKFFSSRLFFGPPTRFLAIPRFIELSQAVKIELATRIAFESNLPETPNLTGLSHRTGTKQNHDRDPFSRSLTHSTEYNGAPSLFDTSGHRFALHPWSVVLLESWFSPEWPHQRLLKNHHTRPRL